MTWQLSNNNNKSNSPISHPPNASHPQTNKQKLSSSEQGHQWDLFTLLPISDLSPSPIWFPHERFPLSVQLLHPHCHCSCVGPYNTDHHHILLPGLPTLHFHCFSIHLNLFSSNTSSLNVPFFMYYSSSKILSDFLFIVTFSLSCQVEEGANLFCISINSRSKTSGQKL